MTIFFDSILYSYAQIFFSNRRWLGGIILIASLISPEIGLLGLLGVVISNLIATLLKFDEKKIRSGYYGFNGILFAAAVGYYFDITLFILLILPLFILISFLISAVIENFFAELFNLPGLSIPFVLSLIIFLVFIGNFPETKINIVSVKDSSLIAFLPDIVKNYFRSFGMILLQADALAGLLIVIGILIFSRLLFMISVFAFTFNYLFLMLLAPHLFDQLFLITSLNSILTAFALGGSLIIPSKKSFLLMSISIMMVVIFTLFFYQLLPSAILILVLPFNFIVLTTLYSLKFRQDQSDLVLLYFSPGSPEENYYYHQNRKSRFDRFKYFFAELPFFGRWLVSQGFNGKHTHKEDWKYAWDFVVVDSDKKEFSNSGNSTSDYFCFGLPVVSPANGTVEKIIDYIDDNNIGEVNVENNWGNTVIINHGEGLFSSISHLKVDSIKVKENDNVRKGDLIGYCGNSGRSPIPHLHFQFQLTNKLGDKTYKYPFAHFIVKENEKLKLKLFDYPEENSLVQNIETHKIVKQAFDFNFGDKFEFDVNINGKQTKETWEVKIDMMNNLYIESSKEDVVYLYKTEKIFYITNYVGKKNSALYYFFLNASQIPLTFHTSLEWSDEISFSLMPNNIIRYLSEFFILSKNHIEVKKFSFFSERLEDDKNIVIKNNLNVLGNNLFLFYKKSFTGTITISEDGVVNNFSFSDDKKLKVSVNKI
ncbi:MAG: hypothetical protein C0425_04235 [Chlorobiaceae bacterium]|nr:hypothetical protein [Chlorobiaceae bacterium]MBA4309525.1 hypothetical protein [Chlorobiaceae bacterium]